MPTLRLDLPATYCIKVQGRIDADWADWFGADAVRISHEEGPPPMTTMIGDFQDQAELYGCLSRLRDLGLPLLLVEWRSNRTESPEVD